MGSTDSSEAFTLHTNATNNGAIGGCAIYSGTPTSGWDVALTGHFNVSTTSWTSTASATTTAANELAIGGFGGAPTTSPSFTGTGGYTCRFTVFAASLASFTLCDKVLAATGAQTATASLAAAGSGGAIVSTIK